MLQRYAITITGSKNRIKADEKSYLKSNVSFINSFPP